MVVKRILVDATHPEETRIVILENGRLQGFSSESVVKQQIKGNVYLAKVMRIEPSLQAAFVEYGGNRHGFLPFLEIHPDYYNIPIDDKKEIINSLREDNNLNDKTFEVEENGYDENNNLLDEAKGQEFSNSENDLESGSDEDGNAKNISVSKIPNLHRRYAIQEVIKKNQILLVQVDKEERHNKGATLTTFISLAGRYCVLLPNAIKKGGISKKITNSEIRLQIKKTIENLAVPEEAALIIRTAGATKNPKNIVYDYQYLANIWNSIRKLTLSSEAPALVHSEGDVIKRLFRDILDDNVSEVIIEGEAAYTSAEAIVKELMPHSSKVIKLYKNKVPVFSRYRVEEQITLLYSPEVPLPSGGSIVINPTEALISIDVNSGKSTDKHTVEETAFATNIEAAYEISRHLKLRDLSGLIVIDFIDMKSYKNRKVLEKTIKDSFQSDKANVQISSISSFGLVQISRQRLCSSFLEVNTIPCPRCTGTGFVRSLDSSSVSVLREVERGIGKKCSTTEKSDFNYVQVYTSNPVLLNILNKRRDTVARIESRYRKKIFFLPDNTFSSKECSLKFITSSEDEFNVLSDNNTSRSDRNLSENLGKDYEKENEKDDRAQRKDTKKSFQGKKQAEVVAKENLNEKDSKLIKTTENKILDTSVSKNRAVDRKKEVKQEALYNNNSNVTKDINITFESLIGNELWKKIIPEKENH